MISNFHQLWATALRVWMSWGRNVQNDISVDQIDDGSQILNPKLLLGVADTPSVQPIERQRNGAFEIPKTYTIPEEVWNAADIKRNYDHILAYFREGPEPFVPSISYKESMIDLVKRRFPYDVNIRNIIDDSLFGIARLNRQYFYLRKRQQLVIWFLLTVLLLIVPKVFASVFASASSKFVLLLALSATALLILTITHQLIKNGVEEAYSQTAARLNSAFQRYSSKIKEYFQKSLFNINQQEHEVSNREWPELARLNVINAMWQAKRVEYAELYMQISMHTARDGLLRGFLGFEYFGHILNVVVYVTIVGSAVILNVAGSDYASVAAYWIVGMLLALYFYSDTLFRTLDRLNHEYLEKPSSVQTQLVKSMRFVSDYLLAWIIVVPGIGALAICAWIGFLSPAIDFAAWGDWLGLATVDTKTAAFPTAAENLLFNTTFALVAALGAVWSFQFASDLDKLTASTDKTKWDEAKDLGLHNQIGDQIMRDKKRIIEEKFRQKDSSRID
jgi:hypothetical protein